MLPRPITTALLLTLTVSLLLAEEAAAQLSLVEIEDGNGRALETFFTALERTKTGTAGAVTRVAHYGDSVIVVDEVSAVVRRAFQQRYGDAGHGFVLAQAPWPWYRHEGIDQGASGGWRIYRSISGGPEDRCYGYGGVAFETRLPSRSLWVGSSPAASKQSALFSKLDVHYLAQPEGGDVEVLVDDQPAATLHTAADKRAAGFHHLEVTPGRHRVELRTTSTRPVRLFGLCLERNRPGVVWDALGLNGTCMTVIGRMNMEHLAQQLHHRRPDLIVLSFGLGEAKRPGLVRRYRRTIRPILQKLRQIHPSASCLITGPTDRGVIVDGAKRSNPNIPEVVAAQREVAAEVGCAFYDAFRSMGGDGAVLRWVGAGLIKSDMTHPTPRGAELLGQALFEALERSHRRWRRGNAQFGTR